MNADIISYEIPQHITDEHNQLITTVEEITELINKKRIEFEKEENSIDFVELSKDEFEHQSEYLEDHRSVLEGITQTLYSSLFISVFTHLETNFYSIIEQLENKTNEKIKLKHLKKDGSFLQCCLNYLKLVQNINLSDFNQTISSLNNLTYIRNVFTHTRGKLPLETTR